MQLVDDVYIDVKAGNGGDGATVTKQMYASKKTMPDGGNGGNGGNVFFKADANISDLSQFQFKKKIRGIDGVSGLNKDLDGANGEDITVLVPFGTTITNETTGEHVELITDLPFCVAYGGTGGMGNHDFKPDVKTFTPRVHLGSKGDDFRLHLVLNLIADIGLVGFPNAGKSSLLKALTNAEPKIGDYPFTTLNPNLGVFEKLVIADVPGLIEGASGGKGLGIKFLKHIKKTKLLLHCVAATEEDPYARYMTIRKEFEEFDSSLLNKTEIILLTKKDLVSEGEIEAKLKALKRAKKPVFAVSVYEEESLEAVRKQLLTSLKP